MSTTVNELGVLIVDPETGEVTNRMISATEHKFRSDEPPFVKLYLADIGLLHNISGSDMNVFHELIKVMQYNNILDLTPRLKTVMLSNLGWKTMSALNSSISRLKKESMLISLGRGSYLVNPKFFAKGAWTDIRKIRTTIEYTPDGTKHMITEFESTTND